MAHGTQDDAHRAQADCEADSEARTEIAADADQHPVPAAHDDAEQYECGCVEYAGAVSGHSQARFFMGS